MDKKLGGEIIWDGEGSMNLEEKIRLARDIGATAEELEKLSEDEEEYVRRKVAQNPQTSAKTLAKMSEDMSEDKYWDVRCCIVRNPQTSAETLAKLSEDENDYVRYNVTQSPKADIIILEKLSGDKVKMVRKSAVQNSSNFRIREIMKVGRESELEISYRRIWNLEMRWMRSWEAELFGKGVEVWILLRSF